jgi:polyhydroxybutyrate depolymerase
VDAITLTVGGVTRRYLLFRPPAAAPRPLVLMLHGTGGSAEFAADETGWAALAADRGFLVAFPDGLPVNPTRPPSFLSNPKRWNDGSTRPGDDLHADTVDDVGFLAGVVLDLVAPGWADPSRVYLTGFSNGAGMAFRFAAERADLLAAVAPIAGYCPDGLKTPARPVPTLFAVGDADRLVRLTEGPVRLPWGNRVVPRPAVTAGLGRWATRLGCEPVPRVVSDSGGVVEAVYPGATAFVSVVVRGLGHHWPGGKGQFNPRIAGPPSAVWPGNERVWAFFERHRPPEREA